MSKKIKSLKVIKAGSNPDVDSDFNTEVREKTIEHIRDIYGEDNVSNIITYNTLAAKGAFKEMCTIYQIPPEKANKLTKLIPKPLDGNEITLAEIFDPENYRYSEGADFRAAVSDNYWKKILDGAINIEGRAKSVGMHACGVIMSDKPLHDVIPLYTRQKDNRTMTQWTYKNCEDLGLIKMDFLGLDTVDLIQHTLENIKKNGKTPPSMLKLIHGPMNDKKTFDMLKSGKSMGIFQLSSSGIQELLVRMQASTFDDLVATNALYRPGPMASNSHLSYADRRVGREKAHQTINPEFDNSALEKILESTSQLIIFQEQIMQISNQIAGMTLQQGDELRSAMGKKKKEKMDKMKPIFIKGGMENGFSEKAMHDLWDTMEPFAKYAFNKSHSVAYAMTSYQSAYLKAHYPVEFVSALISQSLDNKDKVLAYLKEAREMGLKIGTVDINKSDITVSPNYKKKNKQEMDILYGLSGVKAVSKTTSEEIIKEREANGDFKDVEDFINRCQKHNIGNKRVYQNLVLSGAFDNFNISRKGVVENIDVLIKEGKTKKQKGSSLFEVFEVEDDSSHLDLSECEEYDWVEKLRLEADSIGLFLTGHPLENIGTGLSNLSNNTIKKMIENNENVIATLPVSVVAIKKKTTKRGKIYQLSIDDGTGYIDARLSQPIIKGIDKKNAINRIKTLYSNGETNVPTEYSKLISSPNIVPYNDIKENSVYLATISFKKSSEDFSYSARIVNIKPLLLAKNGMLPIRIRFDEDVLGENKAKKLERALPKNLNDKRAGEYPIYKVRYKKLPVPEIIDKYTLSAIEEMLQDKEEKKKRIWPPKLDIDLVEEINEKEEIENKLYTIETLEYEDTGYTASKNVSTKQAIEKFVGDEGYDFGAFDETLLFE